MATEKRVEAHIIFSKYIFPYLVLGSSLTQSTMTQSVFKSGYRPEWSYTKVLIRFPHNSANVTRSTVLGYVSSYIRPVNMGQCPVGGFANTQVFSHWRIMGLAHNCFFCILPVPLSGRTLYIHLTQSHLAVAIFSSILNLS